MSRQHHRETVVCPNGQLMNVLSQFPGSIDLKRVSVAITKTAISGSVP